MAKCAKCTKILGKKNPGVQCNKCSKWLHGSCASLSTDQLCALSATDSVDWKCNRCATTSGGKPKRISVILPDPQEDEEEEAEIEGLNMKEQSSLLQEIRKEVRGMRETVREIIRGELQDTLKFYSEKIDEYEEKIEEYETRLKICENQSKNLANNYKNLELKFGVLEQKLNRFEQAQASNDIEICGVMEKNNENIKQITTQVCELLGQDQEQVIKCYRKKKAAHRDSARAARDAADAPIAVTLREGNRESWLRAAKQTRMSMRDLWSDVEDNNNKQIYVRAALSPSTAYLLWKTKTDLKEKSLCKYVWCKDGLIMVRKAEGDKKIFYVRSANDIETIKKELLKK